MANVENGALQSAINNAAVGETIVLTDNIALTSRITVSNVVTIDLNGYSINGNINDGYGAIYVGTNGVLTIKDSSNKQTGGVTNTIGNAIGNYGVVNIYSGTFTGNYALYNFYYNDSVYGTSAIYGGTFKSVNKDSPSVANSGDLTVSGGTIESIDTSNVLNVTDGTVESLYVGTADYNPPIQSTSVSGGYIAKLSVANDSTNEIVVSGGTFGSEIDSEYFADGFKPTYDEGTGLYGVSADSSGSGGSLKVIATSSSKIRQLTIKNGQLIFIQDLKRIAFDFNNKRVFYNQITELDSEADRLDLENPLNGYYFVIGSACLWFYQGEWIQITEKPQEILFVGVELPELGQEGKLYVDKDDREISVWDDETDKYITVSNYTEEVSDSDIESLFPNQDTDQDAEQNTEDLSD